jgi:RNA polymerase sporulation-specific sigma factor
MESLNTVADEQLWELAIKGTIEAEEELIKRYSSLVRMCARPLFLVGGDSEDLIQEGMIGLISAIRSYDPQNSASFKTYAERCIKNRLYSAIRAAGRQKNSPLNESVPIEFAMFSDDDTSLDPERIVIAREASDDIITRAKNELSGLENEILGYYLDGMSYGDIAAETGKTVKSVDNAVQRIRKKLTRLLNSGEFSIG